MRVEKQKQITNQKANGKVIKILLFNIAIATTAIAMPITITLSWFSNNQRATVSNGSFTVSTPDTVSYNLYYLRSFTVNETSKDGNYNLTTGLFAGYETSYNTPNFVKINYNNNGEVTDNPNPTVTSDIWPAHKLTYAIVITGGSVSNFTLEDWGEVTSEDVKIDANTYVSIAWATDIYGGMYLVNSTANEINDVASGYSNYMSDDDLEDAFVFDEDEHLIPVNKTPINIFSTNIVETVGKRRILYFTIEFSNASSTYYQYNKTTTYYEKSINGNSNCYQNLYLTDLQFALK